MGRILVSSLTRSLGGWYFSATIIGQFAQALFFGRKHTRRQQDSSGEYDGFSVIGGILLALVFGLIFWSLATWLLFM